MLDFSTRVQSYFDTSSSILDEPRFVEILKYLPLPGTRRPDDRQMVRVNEEGKYAR